MDDRIRLAGMAFYGYHGVAEAERQLGQRFVVDVSLSVDLAPAGRADDLALTVDYGTVYEQVRQVVEGPSFRLLEALAEHVAAVVLREHQRVVAVAVTVHKPSAPIQGAATTAVSVTIERGRADGD